MNTNAQIDQTATKSEDGPVARLQQFGDAELLDAWNRDRLSDAFAVLVQRHSRMVLTVCRRKCCSAADADDAFQTTFLLLAKNSAKISRPECLAGWLHRVAHRASIATLSRKNRNTETQFEQAMIDDPLDRITQQHDAIVLDEELAELPEHYRAALVMHVYEECPLERMAEHFQTTLGSIRGRLQRGKKLLARRLRRRGIVPLIAIAAAGSINVSAGEVSAASATLLSSLGDGTVPSPPISENLLNPLVNSGKRIMSPWNVAGGLAAAGSIAALLIAPGFGSDGGGTTAEQSQEPITIRSESEPIVAQFSASAQPMPAGVQSPNLGVSALATPPVTGSIAATTAPATPGQPATGKTVLKHQYHPAVASGPLAQSLAEQMDDDIELQIHGSVATLVEQLEDQLGQPVLLSPRVIEYAKLEPSTALDYTPRSEPLRTALRKLLQPLGLKATIESEGLVVTADHSELVHRGIGTDQWLSVNDAMMRESDRKLSEPIDADFLETPLSEAIAQLSDQLELPIAIDNRSLEEIGLDRDAGIKVQMSGLAAYDLIATMLRDLELTLNVQNNVHTVVTVESAEDALMSRVYWLEGIGLGGDYDGLMSLIETTNTPNTWESMGGNSSMCPAPGKRPGIVVSTTLDVHRGIEHLLAALRENSFALDAVAEEVEVVLPAQPAGQFGGYGGGAGGGMGGGMGAFGGGMGGFQ